MAVINRHRKESIEAQIEIQELSVDKNAQLNQLWGKDALVRNTFTEPHAAEIHSSNLNIARNTFSHSFPPHSVSILKFQITKKGVKERNKNKSTLSEEP
ncbi:MAG: hypothetical protein ACUVQZ_06235 [Candidatus Caldatribacteriaceae bacterium]